MRYIFILIVILFFQCNLFKNQLNDKPAVQIMDKKQASVQIVDDDINRLLERFQPTERSIQMQVALEKATPQAYKSFLAEDVTDFSPEEKEILLETFEKAKIAIEKLNPKLWPEAIKLIKTKGNHYGPGVFYTREECIVIPPNQVSTENEFYEVMLHEIWHIISRYNPELVRDVYAVFGFEKHCASVSFDENLQSRMLINPDGSEFDYAIELKPGQWALPFISSRYAAYNSGTFMDHLDFGLYYLDANCKTKTENRVPNSDFPLYFDKITKNTDYIIHPDEISADNFIYAVQQTNGKEYDFDDKGQKALNMVVSILKNADNISFVNKD